jgi:hypothetical protein
MGALRPNGNSLSSSPMSSALSDDALVIGEDKNQIALFDEIELITRLPFNELRLLRLLNTKFQLVKTGLRIANVIVQALLVPMEAPEIDEAPVQYHTRGKDRGADPKDP